MSFFEGRPEYNANEYEKNVLGLLAQAQFGRNFDDTNESDEESWPTDDGPNDEVFDPLRDDSDEDVSVLKKPERHYSNYSALREVMRIHKRQEGSFGSSAGSDREEVLPDGARDDCGDPELRTSTSKPASPTPGLKDSVSKPTSPAVSPAMSLKGSVSKRDSPAMFGLTTSFNLPENSPEENPTHQRISEGPMSSPKPAEPAEATWAAQFQLDVPLEAMESCLDGSREGGEANDTEPDQTKPTQVEIFCECKDGASKNAKAALQALMAESVTTPNGCDGLAQQYDVRAMDVGRTCVGASGENGLIQQPDVCTIWNGNTPISEQLTNSGCDGSLDQSESYEFRDSAKEAQSIRVVERTIQRLSKQRATTIFSESPKCKTQAVAPFKVQDACGPKIPKFSTKRFKRQAMSDDDSDFDRPLPTPKKKGVGRQASRRDATSTAPIINTTPTSRRSGLRV